MLTALPPPHPFLWCPQLVAGLVELLAPAAAASVGHGGSSAAAAASSASRPSVPALLSGVLPPAMWQELEAAVVASPPPHAPRQQAHTARAGVDDVWERLRGAYETAGVRPGLLVMHAPWPWDGGYMSEA